MQKKPSILLVDDESSIRRALRDILEYEGYYILDEDDGQKALERLKNDHIDLILLDIKMKGMDGLEVLSKLREEGHQTPVIMLSGHGNIETAVKATQLGAYDFLEKPPDLNRLLVAVRNALDRGALVRENVTMRRKIGNVKEIIGTSAVINQIKNTIQKVAPTDARVLITGENGTGKELVARWLHEFSKRSNKPFVDVNCAAIPPDLLESELFGHEKGAFTGAVKQRIGKFEQANGGTLFLDEIGDMSLASQAKVLRALQENIITRVGGNESVKVDVRVLAATNKDLQEEIQAGNFREDLYHRLNVIPIHVPPLRERRSDIPLLAQSFIEDMAGKDILFAGKHFSSAALQRLSQMNWSGNVRELHNVVERLGILSEGNEIDEALVMSTCSMPASSGEEGISQLLLEHADFHAYKDATERIFIKHQLELNDWNISQTAEKIGIQRSHLYNKIKKFDLER